VLVRKAQKLPHLLQGSISPSPSPSSPFWLLLRLLRGCLCAFRNS
jgi:hypothetical protein